MTRRAKVNADPESNQSNAVNNPYSNPIPTILPTWHPLNVMKRILYMGVALYAMNYFNAYQKIMHSPKVSHEWFKIGLAASVAVLFVKAYVEIYAGKMMKQEVSYKKFPQSTHAVMILMLICSVSFHVALWPEYGPKSMLIMFLLAMFLLNFCLLMPTYVQNLVGFAVLTFFLQEYQ